MEPKRRQQMTWALAIVIAGGAIYSFWPGTTATAPAASNGKGDPSTTRGAQTQIAAPDVHLEALQAARPRPDEVKRDLFRFKPKPPPPAPVVAPRPVGPPAVPSGPPPPPPPPPIPLKFAGILTQGSVKVAVLIDTVGHQIYGKEGETIEGRYKIWRIGTESIEISYIDGRGRRLIPMNGS